MMIGDIWDQMGNSNPEAEEQKQEVTRKKTRRVRDAANENFVISETKIASNPVYQIMSDVKLSDRVKADKLKELKQYNETLSEEENETNREAFNEMLLYIENQLKESAQKTVEFTNDNAFSLYDETIRKLFNDIKTFKGMIEPFVAALNVLQKAREKGVPANQMIDSVEGMQEQLNSLTEEHEAEQQLLKYAEDSLVQYNKDAEKISKGMEAQTIALKNAKEDQKTTKDSWFVFQKGKKLRDHTATVRRTETRGRDLASEAQDTASKIESTQARIQELKGKITTLVSQKEEIQQKFSSNDDVSAISKLIEITGADFQDKRQKVVTSAQDIVTEAVNGIEQSISRFKSGKNETGTQLDTIVNLNGMVSVINAADQSVRVLDAKYIAEKEAIIKRIKEEKGEQATLDPEYEKTLKHVNIAKKHAESVTASASRATNLNGKLIGQTSTFKGLQDAYSQKEQDAIALRTDAAVQIPSQLAVTVKSVEMATATESNNMVSDAFAELGKATAESIGSVFKTVVAGKGQNTKRLEKALEDAMSTVEMLDGVAEELREASAQEYDVRRDLESAQEQLDEATKIAGSASIDAEQKEIRRDDMNGPAL